MTQDPLASPSTTPSGPLPQENPTDYEEQFEEALRECANDLNRTWPGAVREMAVADEFFMAGQRSRQLEIDRLTVLAKAATDVYQRLHRAQDYREKEALWSALEAAVEAVNG